MAFVRRLSVLTLLLCVFISLAINNRRPDPVVPAGDRSSPPPSSSPLLPSLESNFVRWLSWSSPSSMFMSNFPSPSFPVEYLQEDNITFPREDEEGESDHEECDDDESCETLLVYDFYRDSCPRAEKIVHDVVGKLYGADPAVAPALLRLVFHDCFIEGCDASVLLDAVEGGMGSEKDSPGNKGLRGFDVVDTIKSEMEEACPGVVSCADILVLAAREAVVQAGGPFYPLFTGRRDSSRAYKDIATFELPSPHGDLSETLAAFSSRGFDERETVALFGGHSVGVIHCTFFHNRLYNFSGTNKPDPSLDDGFLNVLRSRCSDEQDKSAIPQPPSFGHSIPPSTTPSAIPTPSVDGPEPVSFEASPFSSPLASSKPPSTTPAPSFDSWETPFTQPAPSINGLEPSTATPIPSPSSSTASSPVCLDPVPSSSPSKSARSSPYSMRLLHSKTEDRGMDMAYEGRGVAFGTLYYHSLLQGRGILYVDQQLTAGEETGVWVRAYASDNRLFRKDFAQVMMKLSNLQVLAGSLGQVRLNCSKAS